MPECPSRVRISRPLRRSQSLGQAPPPARHQPLAIRSQGNGPNFAWNLRSEDAKLPTAGAIPDPSRTIRTSRDDPLPVRGYRDGVDVAGVPLECQKLAAAGGIPDPSRAIRTSADDPLPVRGYRDGADPVGVSLKGPGSLDNRHIPNLRRAIPACCRQPLPIRAYGHSGDRAPMPLEGEDFSLAGRIPNLSPAGGMSGYQPLPIGERGDGQDMATPNRDTVELLSGLRIPDRCRIIIARGEQALAVRRHRKAIDSPVHPEPADPAPE